MLLGRCAVFQPGDTALVLARGIHPDDGPERKYLGGGSGKESARHVIQRDDTAIGGPGRLDEVRVFEHHAAPSIGPGGVFDRVTELSIFRSVFPG